VLCPVPGRRPSHRRLRRGFTLIELVTAAALMTIMMLGVIQIFATITTAAGDAQGFQFTQEQSRALLDTIKRDLRGLTREGYLRIVLDATASNYTGDLLAFTTVGSASTCWATTPATAGAYEAVYTTHVKTPDNERVIKIGSRTINVDQRRGILGRGIWLMWGKANGMGTDTEDATKRAPWLADMEANITSNPTNYRRSLDTMQIWPLTSADGFAGAQNPPSLRRVLASCCSEFRVEYMLYSPSDNDYKWYHDVRDIVAGQRGGSSLKLFPRAIRVTVAIHDPDDRKPLTGGSTARFQGYASQEVFWISDP
jgi:prepilin-type N-terminal cleavage/methylation domain-containing protein